MTTAPIMELRTLMLYGTTSFMWCLSSGRRWSWYSTTSFTLYHFFFHMSCSATLFHRLLRSVTRCFHLSVWPSVCFESVEISKPSFLELCHLIFSPFFSISSSSLRKLSRLHCHFFWIRNTDFYPKFKNPKTSKVRKFFKWWHDLSQTEDVRKVNYLMRCLLNVGTKCTIL